jgi:hypothetical protein
VQRDDLLALRGMAAGRPQHHDVRVQRDQAFHVDRRNVPDARHTARRRRLVRVLHRRDDLAAGAGPEQHLGRPGRQAHDAQRRLGHLYLAPRVVGDPAQRGAPGRVCQPRQRPQQGDTD